MSSMHKDDDDNLAEINTRIAILKAICNLEGTDEHVFESIRGASLDHAATDPEERALQELKGLLFMKTHVRMLHYRNTNDVLPD